MASPSFRSSTVFEMAAGTSMPMPKPTGLATPDIMLARVYYEENSVLTVTPPAGWADYPSCTANNTGPNPDQHVQLFWKRAGTADVAASNFPFTFSASTDGVGHLAAWSGALDTGTPLEAGGTVVGNGTACTLPSITALTAETAIIGFTSSFDWTKTWSSSALTERADSSGGGIYSGTQAAAGTTGTKLISQSGSDQFIGIICILASQAAAGGTTHHGEAVMQGAGAFAAQGKKLAMGAAALSGIGAVSASAKKVAMAQAALSGIGALAASGQRVALGASAMQGVGSLAASATRIARGEAALQGIAALIAGGTKTANAQAALSGIASIIAGGQRITRGEVALSGVGALSANATKVAHAEAILHGIAALVADGTTVTAGIVRGEAVLAAIGSMSATAIKTARAEAAMQGMGALSADAVKILRAEAQLQAIAQLIADGVVIIKASASLQGSSSLAARAIMVWAARAALQANGALSASGTLIEATTITHKGRRRIERVLHTNKFQLNPQQSNYRAIANSAKESDKYVRDD